MTIHTELKPDEERELLKLARLSGRDPVSYAQQIIQDHIVTPLPETDKTNASIARVCFRNPRTCDRP